MKYSWSSSRWGREGILIFCYRIHCHLFVRDARRLLKSSYVVCLVCIAQDPSRSNRQMAINLRFCSVSSLRGGWIQHVRSGWFKTTQRVAAESWISSLWKLCYFLAINCKIEGTNVSNIFQSKPRRRMVTHSCFFFSWVTQSGELIPF